MTNLTASMIEKDDKLMMVLVAQVASALEKTQWVLGEFYEAGKNMFTGGNKYRSGMAWLDTVVHKFTPEALKQLGLEKVGGVDLDMALRNILTEYKSVATLSNVKEEARKRLIEQGYKDLVFIVAEYSDLAVDKIDELLATEEYKDKSITLLKYNPRKALSTLGIAPDLDEMQEKALASLEETNRVIEESKEEGVDDLQSLRDTIASLDEDVKGEVAKATGKVAEKGSLDEDKLDDVLSALDDIDFTTKDTNKEVKSEDLNKTEVEKDPTEDK